MEVTLSKVILVLSDTIAAKERYLAELERKLAVVPVRYDEAGMADRLVDKAAVGFLILNIDELKAIRKDLEQVRTPTGPLNLVATVTAAKAPSND